MTRILLISSLLLIAAAVYLFAPGVLDQAGIVLGDYRPGVLILLAVLTVAAHGLVNGSFYSQGKLIDIHLAAEIMGALHFLMILAAGLGLIEAIGATFVGQFGFQAFVNAGSGLPLVDPAERKRYTVGGKDWSFKRIFLGRWRYLQLAIGAGLIILGWYL